MSIKKCFTCKLNSENYCLCDYPRNKFLISTRWNTDNCPWYKERKNDTTKH